MNENDKQEFVEWLQGIAAMKRVDLSTAVIRIWYQTLIEYDFSAIKSAFEKHLKDPDGGHWMPQPSDIIRIIDGGVGEQAELAWAKAFRAVSLVGSYSDVVFDDSIIHAVIDGMGGWVKFCQGEYKDFDFKRLEFVKAYRAIKNRGASEYVGVLQGISNTQNRMHGFRLQEPQLVGNEEKALSVMRCGVVGDVLKIKQFSGVVGNNILKLTNNEQ